MTIKQLKEKIAEDMKTPVESQKLILMGKQLDDDAKTVTDYNIKEGDFIVLFVTKAKPVAKPEEAKAEEPKPVATPLVNI